MTPLYKKLLDADVIVLGSPNFFANVSGITKDLIDRTLPFYHKTALKNKKIFLIST
jgi:multimeric flavodoxin WrbA